MNNKGQKKATGEKPIVVESKAKQKTTGKVRKVELKSIPEIKKQTAFSRFLKTAVVAAVFLVIGMAVVYIAFYMPKSNAFSEVDTELKRLQQVEADYSQLQTDYSTMEEKHQVAVTLVDIFKIQNNVNIARIALLENDQTRLSQALDYIDRDIDTLDISSFPGITVDLKSRMDEVKKAVPKDLQKALNELELLFNDLLLLANNLEITD